LKLTDLKTKEENENDVSFDAPVKINGCRLNFKYLVANVTVFGFLFHRLVLRLVNFTYSNFAWGLHGGVDVK